MSVAVMVVLVAVFFNFAIDNWVYYIVFFLLELVVYTIMIVTIGTCLGQWRFFCTVAFKMWGWILPIQIRQSVGSRLQLD